MLLRSGVLSGSASGGLRRRFKVVAGGDEEQVVVPQLQLQSDLFCCAMRSLLG